METHDLFDRLDFLQQSIRTLEVRRVVQSGYWCIVLSIKAVGGYPSSNWTVKSKQRWRRYNSPSLSWGKINCFVSESFILSHCDGSFVFWFIRKTLLSKNKVRYYKKYCIIVGNFILLVITINKTCKTKNIYNASSSP